MDIYGYGEDALTLWTFHHRLDALLSQLDDEGPATHCTLFFRPSFGRRGGEQSAQFGEFDFILLTPNRLYLGESKWDRSPETSGSSKITLRREQILRHQIFRQYVRHWTCGMYSSWDAFLSAVETTWPTKKPMAPEASLLSENLQTVLRVIQARFRGTPEIVNVLLYLYDGNAPGPRPTEVPRGFKLVSVDYSSGIYGNYIRL